MQAGESHVMSQALVRHYASRVRMFCLAAAVLATGIVCPAPQGIAGTDRVTNKSYIAHRRVKDCNAPEVPNQ